MKSWAPWVKARKAADADRKAVEEARKRVEATIAAALATERRQAWWRLAEAHGWKGGKPHSAVVPMTEQMTFRRFWDSIGAPKHQTEA